MKIGFVLAEATFLKYYFFLIKEFVRRGHVCNIYVPTFITKLTNPLRPPNKVNIDFILENIKNVEMWLYDSKEVLKNMKDDVVFFVEAVHADKDIRSTKISFTYATDFVGACKTYDSIDYAVPPSEWFVRNVSCDKWKFLGCPKYDCIDSFSGHEKYNLNKDDKHALVLVPRIRDVNFDVFFNMLYKIQAKKYVPLIKTREKDDVYKLPFHKFGDISYNIPTTLELMSLSDVIFLFDSIAIKEAVIMEKPTINIQVKPWKTSEEPIAKIVTNTLQPLYDGKCVKEFVGWENALEAVEHMTGFPSKSEYQKKSNKYFDLTSQMGGNVSSYIVDFCESV